MDREEYQDFLKEALEKIQKAHRENYLSIFAGAGVSVESKLPSWSGLIDDLKKCLKNTDKDDFLTIAEKFYKKYGEKAYYQRIKELIPDNVEANKLHDKIVNLNIKNLITTNWDNLFEKAIENNGTFFHEIKQDNHIRYTTGYSRLIKMHGSLDKNNIVFRKTDYKKYNKKFPLIENYVKAIFSTDVVLLIGYSLGDSNVQQILSWLKNCSKQEKLSIYLVKTKDKFSFQDFNYYREKYDVAIFYLEELYPQEERSWQLIKFFEYIENKSITNNQQKISSILLEDELDSIVEMLRNFDNNKIQEKIEKIEQNIEITDEQELQKAFLLYHTHRDFESYETLKRLSKESFKHRNHKIWYISEFNRRSFVFPIMTNCIKDIYQKLKKGDRYEEEKQHINLEENYLRLPIDIRDNIKSLTLLELDLHRELLEVYRLKEAICNDYETYRDGGISLNNNIKQVVNILDKVENRRVSLLLLYSHDEFFQNAIEAFLVALGGAFLIRKKYKKACLEIQDMKMPYLLFSYTIRYFETKNLIDIFNKYYKKEDYFIFEEQPDIVTIFTNICSLFNCFGAFITSYSRWFNNFLIISAWIKVEQNVLDFILDSFCDKLAQRVVSLNEYQSINYFICNQYTKNKNVNFVKLKNLICTYMSIFSDNHGLSIHDMEAEIYSNVFSNIFIILRKQECQLTYKEYSSIIQRFIASISLIHMVCSLNKFLINIHRISDKPLQELISSALREKLQQATIREIREVDKRLFFDDSFVKDNCGVSMPEELKYQIQDALGYSTILSFCKKLVDNNILIDQDYQDLQKKYGTKEIES